MFDQQKAGKSLPLLFFFFFFFDHPVPQSLNPNRCVINPLDADAGASAADGAERRNGMYMSEKIGVRHAPADVQRLVGEHEEGIVDDRKVITLFKTQIPPFLRREIQVVVAHHQKFVAFKL